MGKDNPDLVVLDADLSHSTMTHFFAAKFPDRFFNCGIAEQNMVSIAAGLAASGKVPFASTFAVFAPGRCFDQVRMSIAQPGLNVKLVTTHGGITVGEDGITHQAIEDLSLICSLPGFTVIVPADAVETAEAVRWAAAHRGPVYIRLGRAKLPLVYGPEYRFQPGKAVTMRPGSGVTVIAIGIMVNTALAAAETLQNEGIECRVLNMPTLKPIDEAAIVQAAHETGAIVTAEEHLEHGGLGSEVARVVAQKCPVPMEIVAIKDTYAQSGKPAELLQRYGLTAGDIVRSVSAVLKRK
jgi:transketolase